MAQEAILIVRYLFGAGKQFFLPEPVDRGEVAVVGVRF